MLYADVHFPEPQQELERDWQRVLTHGWELFRAWEALRRPMLEDLACRLQNLGETSEARLAAFGGSASAGVRRLCAFARRKPAPEAWAASFPDHVAHVMGHQIPGGGMAMDIMAELAGLWGFLAQRGFFPANDYAARLGRCLDQQKPYRLLALIPARGGSKGVPRKALRRLGHKPLIAYTIEAALAIPGADKVVVSTDDPEIRDQALAHGALAPFLRPKELAGDHSNLTDVLQHCVQWFRDQENFCADILGVLSPTHPYRRPGLLHSVLRQALADPEIRNVTSVSPADVDLNNLWTRQNGHSVPMALPALDPETRLCQSAFSFNFQFWTRFTNAHGHNRSLSVLLDPVEAIDIDTPYDLEFARAVLDAGLAPGAADA